MIPDKTPALAAIAWITVVMAYAWVSNRDYDDAVLVRRSGLQTATVGAPPPGRRTEPPRPPETAKALFRPTPHTGDHP